MRKLIFFGLIFLGLWIFFKRCQGTTDRRVMKLTEANYGSEIDRFCQKKGLPAAYFKALVVLECSGKKPVKGRFEPHVYKMLRQVSRGERKSYSGLTKKELGNRSESVLKQLATSWGPFQLMGYHCLRMKVPLDKLKFGDSSIEIGIRWCAENYGNRLKKKQFRDAFHIHNTGKPYPKYWFPETHDPAYVSRGLAYLAAWD